MFPERHEVRWASVPDPNVVVGENLYPQFSRSRQARLHLAAQTNVCSPRGEDRWGAVQQSLCPLRAYAGGLSIDASAAPQLHSSSRGQAAQRRHRAGAVAAVQVGGGPAYLLAQRDIAPFREVDPLVRFFEEYIR